MQRVKYVGGWIHFIHFVLHFGAFTDQITFFIGWWLVMASQAKNHLFFVTVLAHLSLFKRVMVIITIKNVYPGYNIIVNQCISLLVIYLYLLFRHNLLIWHHWLQIIVIILICKENSAFGSHLSFDCNFKRLVSPTMQHICYNTPCWLDQFPVTARLAKRESVVLACCVASCSFHCLLGSYVNISLPMQTRWQKLG